MRRRRRAVGATGFFAIPIGMRPFRRTKIVATLGPASSSDETVHALLQAGVDVVRLNGSHGDHAQHRAHTERVRRHAAALGRNVAIMFDLQGPKIRVGTLGKEGVGVAPGQEVAFAVGRAPDAGELPCDYDGLAGDVAVGQPMLIDDGNVQLEVCHVRDGLVRARARNAGLILSRKGINLPGSAVRLPALTDKDRADALFAVGELQVDLLALSFVRRAADVDDLVAHLAVHQLQVPIVSKIEKPQALQALDEILRASWAVMVARGDLGVELSYAEVPMAQKRIIRAARLLGKPVITATQMLDSMTTKPTPTRAEASDVANAVLDGTDAVMLSGESASGQYPIDSVRAMGRIIDAVEQTPLPPKVPRGRAVAVGSGPGSTAVGPSIPEGTDDTPAAVADAGCQVAHVVGARVLAAFTESGRMALLCSQKRPTMPIVAFAGSQSLQRCLALVWGVCAVHARDAAFVPARLPEVDATLGRLEMAASGDKIVLLVGAPRAPSGSTNLMVVHKFGHDDALGSHAGSNADGRAGSSGQTCGQPNL